MNLPKDSSAQAGPDGIVNLLAADSHGITEWLYVNDDLFVLKPQVIHSGGAAEPATGEAHSNYRVMVTPGK